MSDVVEAFLKRFRKRAPKGKKVDINEVEAELGRPLTDPEKQMVVDWNIIAISAVTFGVRPPHVGVVETIRKRLEKDLEIRLNPPTTDPDNE